LKLPTAIPLKTPRFLTDTSYEHLSAQEGRSMRPTFIHVLMGLMLGTALAGLLNVPGQVVAHQESIPPVSSPRPAKPKGELVVRVAPEVERPVAAKKAKPAKPRVVVRKVFVRAVPPAPQPVPARPPAPKPAAKPAAKERPKSPPPPPPPPAPPKTVVSNPQPAPPPPPPSGDEDDDDDGGDVRPAGRGGGDDDDDGGGGDDDDGSDGDDGDD
jgi:outer membrane biosynthesis protein TonB